MKINCLKILLTITFVASSSIASAGIIPYGIQTNLTQATIEGWGWTECSRSSALSVGTPSIPSVFSSCDGSYLMMTAWDGANQNYGIAAAGETTVVEKLVFTSSTDDRNFSTLENWSNGVNFYRSGGFNGAWGFTNINSVSLNNIDINLFNVRQQMTGAGTQTTEAQTGKDAIGLSWSVRNGVFRNIGNDLYNPTGLTSNVLGSTADQRVFFKYTAPASVPSVPEPSTVAIFALGMIGLASRRFKK